MPGKITEVNGLYVGPEFMTFESAERFLDYILSPDMTAKYEQWEKWMAVWSIIVVLLRRLINIQPELAEELIGGKA